MKDLSIMKPNEKFDYIFAERQSEMFPDGRFRWIDCLLGDVQTFLDGIKSYLQSKPPGRGGGNLSVPILLSTALGLVSDLYVGKTDYMERMGHIDKNSYHADNNVPQFVKRFFPEHYNRFPLLMWDGVRNGVTHVFSPKPLRYEEIVIRFQFSVEEMDAASYITKDTTNEENRIYVRINVFELYDVFKKAIEGYRQELKTDQKLQNNFISSWDSIETYIRDISHSENDKLSEARALVAQTESANNHLVLLRGRHIGNVTKSQRGNPPSIVNFPTANTTLP